MNITNAAETDAFPAARLLAWINQHDCGVRPCGVANSDGSITIRVSEVRRDGTAGIHCERVTNLTQARAALGY